MNGNGAAALHVSSRPDGARPTAGTPASARSTCTTRSGVANHFFYLWPRARPTAAPARPASRATRAVATGTGTLTGIGRAKAEKIWYRALTRVHDFKYQLRGRPHGDVEGRERPLR